MILVDLILFTTIYTNNHTFNNINNNSYAFKNTIEGVTSLHSTINDKMLV